MVLLGKGYRFFKGDVFNLRTLGRTGDRVFAQISVLYDDGGESNIPLELTSASDRTSVSATTSPVTRGGIVVGVNVIALVSAALKPSDLYAQVRIGHPTALRRQWMCKGYIHGERQLSMGEFEDNSAGVGRKVDNEAASTLGNNTALTRTITVPTSARWKIYGGTALNADSVTRTIDVRITDGTESLFDRLMSGNALSGDNQGWPSPEASRLLTQLGEPPPLVGGDEIEITWAAGGASAGGTARSSAVVTEWMEP